MQVSPINRHWVHIYLVEPYLQGCRLCNLAWEGVDFEHLNRPTISLKNRVISWLQGFVLLVPFVNVMVWTFWQTFGNPPPLRDPFNPEIAISPRVAPPRQQPPVQEVPQPTAPPPLFSPSEVEQIGSVKSTVEIPLNPAKRPPDLSYYETNSDGIPTSSYWLIDQHEESRMVQQDCSFYNCVSIYKQNGSLSESHYQMGNIKLDIWIRDTNQVKILLNDQESNLELEKGIPVFQQPNLSLKDFVLSDKEQTQFYIISPVNPLRNYLFMAAKPPLLMQFNAKKLEVEEVEGWGKLQKVEIISKWGFPYNRATIHFWFDPTTGDMKQYLFSGLGAWKKGTLQS